MIFLGFIAFVASLPMLLCPDIVWMVTESWKSYASEPTDLYKLSVRIGGTILCLASLLVIILSMI